MWKVPGIRAGNGLLSYTNRGGAFKATLKFKEVEDLIALHEEIEKNEKIPPKARDRLHFILSLAYGNKPGAYEFVIRPSFFYTTLPSLSNVLVKNGSRWFLISLATGDLIGIYKSNDVRKNFEHIIRSQYLRAIVPNGTLRANNFQVSTTPKDSIIVLNGKRAIKYYDINSLARKLDTIQRPRGDVRILIISDIPRGFIAKMFSGEKKDILWEVMFTSSKRLNKVTIGYSPNTMRELELLFGNYI